MTSAEAVATAFAACLKKRDFDGAETFWADDVVSVESMGGPMKELRGRAAVHGKTVWWNDNHTVHAMTTEGPFVNGDQFVLVFRIDLTQKATNTRLKMDEAALYTVKADKIAEERFFPAAG